MTPEVWSYEGESHGRHKCSICIGPLDDASAPHVCFATAYGTTEVEAVTRGHQIAKALKAEANLTTLRAQLHALPRYYLQGRYGGEIKTLTDHENPQRGDWIKAADLDALLGPEQAKGR